MEQKLVRGFAGGNELPMESQSSHRQFWQAIGYRPSEMIG